jgi:rhamnogalacturonyl hydrolase YesR
MGYVNLKAMGNTTNYIHRVADIETQFSLMYNNTIQLPGAVNYTGLLYHGYDYSHTASWASADRGHSPEVWDRAMGWYMMALVDTLEILPSTPAAAAQARKTLLAQLGTLAPRVVSAADKTTGVWWLVVTEPGRVGNYFESSGAAMFVYALLKAVRLGYISDNDRSVVAAAQKAYQYLLTHFVSEKSDGTMDWTGTVHVGSLDTTGDFQVSKNSIKGYCNLIPVHQYYISQSVNVNDLKGVAAFVLASLEYEKL